MARYLADLHLHSHFSRATSRDLTPPELARWGRKKGLTLLGTGDCTHPGWLDELETCLLPDGRGLLRLAPGWDPSVRDLPPTLASWSWTLQVKPFGGSHLAMASGSMKVR